MNVLKFYFKLQPRNHYYLSKMAKSKFEYVREFETEDKTLLLNCWIVVRIDGKGFHKFSRKHGFLKPNDLRALNLMNRAAVSVMQDYKDIVIAFGESDEYSFVFRKETEIYKRRASKILSYVNSLFSSAYVFFWKHYFGNVALQYPPSFDARIVLYPSEKNLCDYLSWRQVDTHINNLYNTTFWTLIQKGGLNNTQAQDRLSGTTSAVKNEILFSEFGMNYNDELVIFKKGTILLWKKIKYPSNNKLYQVVLPIHEDMLNNAFWTTHNEILVNKSAQIYNWPVTEPLPEIVLTQLPMTKIDQRFNCQDAEKNNA